MTKKLRGLLTDEHGQGMTEYGLVLGVIAVAVVGLLATLRTEIVEMYNNIVTLVTNSEDGSGA
jgi:pilus assembly protein Flp/PilA